MAARTGKGVPPPDGDPSERAREVALRLLTHAPRSAASLKEGLLSRGIEEDLAEQVVTRYREVGLIDDAALAAMIAKTRHRERGYARRAISVELRRKGFEAADIASALEQIGDDDERAMAEVFASRRWGAMLNLAPEVRARRLMGAICRRGYSPGLAATLVRNLEHADIWDNRSGEVELAREE
jgi:regulatory protein